MPRASHIPQRPSVWTTGAFPLGLFLLSCLKAGAPSFAPSGGKAGRHGNIEPKSRLRAAGAGQRAQPEERVAPLSPAEGILCNQLAEYAQASNWSAVEAAFSGYSGTARAVFSKVISAAFRCGQYERGIEVYQKFHELGVPKTIYIYAHAIRLFAKTGNSALVEKTWAEALDTKGVGHLLASSRLYAAAEDGDMVTAAAVLDRMVRAALQPDLRHFAPAVRACSNADDDSNYKVASYFMDKLGEGRIAPDALLFSTLIKSYRRADLEYVTSAYKKMKDFGIQPDRSVAEAYLTTLLQLSPGMVKDRMDVYLKQVTVLPIWGCRV